MQILYPYDVAQTNGVRLVNGWYTISEALNLLLAALRYELFWRPNLQRGHYDLATRNGIYWGGNHVG
jgi:hypothetical protein